MADKLGADLDHVLPQLGQRPMFYLFGQREVPKWVNTRRTGASPERSAPGGEADEIRGKADVAA